MNPYHQYYEPHPNRKIGGISYEQYYLDHQDDYVKYVNGYDQQLKSFEHSGKITFGSLPIFDFDKDKLIEDNDFNAKWFPGSGYCVAIVTKK